MKRPPLLLSILLAASSALAAEPKAVDRPAAAASAPSGNRKAQTDVSRKPESPKAAAATGPGTQTADDVYVGVKKK